MDPAWTITCEELLARTDWVRGLVRRIVLDEDGVDDVVQELHLHLWRRRPRLSGDPRSWLAAVSRNLARRARRDESVRREHEARAAVERPRGAADEGLARLRLQRTLADAVLALREPYRGAVIERHLDGLDYVGMAARHGISEEAARKRVSRGLELLRARLENELDGDGRDACFALLGLRVEGGGTGIETATLGGIAMGAKLVAGAMLLGLAAAGYFLWPATPRASAVAAGPETTSAEEPSRLSAPPSSAGTAADAGLAPAERDALPALVPEPGLVPAPDREHDLHGRVRDPGGRPVAGARVEVRRDRFREYVTLEHAQGRGRRGATVAEAATDERGEFRVPLPLGQPFDLWVESRGRATASFPDRYAGEFVDVLLGGSAVLLGSVRDSADGTPVAGARVRAWKDDASGLVVLDGATDSQGEYRFEGLEPGRLRLHAGATGRTQVSEPFGVLLVEGGVHRHDIELNAGFTVFGRVFDDASGAPVAGAVVGQSRSPAETVLTDARGEYELAGLESRGQGELFVRAAGYGRSIQALDFGDSSRLRADVGLFRGRRVLGRVLDGEGRPLAGAYVAAVSTLPEDGTESPGDWCSAHSGAEGGFEIRDVSRRGAHVLFVVREGFGTELVTLPELDPELAVLDVGDLVLLGGGEIRGRVLDERGRGVSDCRVRLQRAGERARLGRVADVLNPYRDDEVLVGERTARTDDLGRFRFADLAPGGYLVEASRYRLGAVTVTQEFDGSLATSVSVARGESITGVELVLDLGQSISGRMLDEQGTPVPSMLVWLNPVEAGAGPELNLVTAADGRFEFRGLARGAYDLYAYATGIGAASGPPPFLNAERAAVPSGTLDLEIVLERVRPTTGFVRNADGTPAAKASLFAFDATGKRVDLSYADADGRFTLTLEPGTIAEILARPAPSDGPYWDQSAVARIPAERGVRFRDVVAGDREIEIELPAPRD